MANALLSSEKCPGILDLARAILGVIVDARRVNRRLAAALARCDQGFLDTALAFIIRESKIPNWNPNLFRLHVAALRLACRRLEEAIAAGGGARPSLFPMYNLPYSLARAGCLEPKLATILAESHMMVSRAYPLQRFQVHGCTAHHYVVLSFVVAVMFSPPGPGPKLYAPNSKPYPKMCSMWSQTLDMPF
jgi:hypothetical protein